MKVILREEVSNLGRIGDVVKVKPGFARNFLLPRGAAVEANPKNVRSMEHEKRVSDAKARKVYEASKLLADKVNQTALSFKAKVGEEDKLFGSITSKDIAEALAAKGVAIDRKKIVVAEPIKRLGEHTVEVKVGQDVTATVKITVEAE